MSDKVRAYLNSDSRLGADFFVGLYIKEPNEMLTLTSSTLRGMSELRAKLGFDIYLEVVPDDSSAPADATA